MTKREDFPHRWTQINTDKKEIRVYPCLSVGKNACCTFVYIGFLFVVIPNECEGSLFDETKKIPRRFALSG